MSKKAAQGLVLAISVFFLQSAGTAQGLKGRFGWGLGVGAQQQYSDVQKTPFGFGGEGLLTYRLTDQVSVSFHTGYNVLGFKPVPAAPTVNTNLFYGDLVLDYELTQKGTVRPFFMGGIGGLGFQVKNSKRFYDGEILLGGGFRAFLNPRTALTFSGNAKYTTGDDLDGGNRTGNSLNDAYVTLRTGVTFYMGGGSSLRDERLFTDLNKQNTSENDPFFTAIESSPNDKRKRSDGEYSDFLQKLSSLENSAAQPGAKNSYSMEEYVRLKSRIDELNAAIDSKENEIRGLQNALVQKNDLQASLSASSQVIAKPLDTSSIPVENVVVNDFSKAYELALNKFYRRDLAASVAIFQKLLQTYPNHSLASNCQYWLGEDYFAAGDYINAAKSFERVLTYERSLKKDDALMMLGKTYANLGRADDARMALMQLVRDYPDSEFVPSAEKMLKKL